MKGKAPDSTAALAYFIDLLWRSLWAPFEQRAAGKGNCRLCTIASLLSSPSACRGWCMSISVSGQLTVSCAMSMVHAGQTLSCGDLS